MTSGQWKGSKRRDELPPDWPAIRRRQLERDGYRCRDTLHDGSRCPEVATDVDHMGSKWDHSRLQSLCADHHKKKTAQQGVQARRDRKEAARRPPERHPGKRM